MKENEHIVNSGRNLKKVSANKGLFLGCIGSLSFILLFYLGLVLIGAVLIVADPIVPAVSLRMRFM